MICENCQHDTPSGQTYAFYYGNQTGKIRRNRQTITTYSIGGAQQSFLCNNCVFAHAMRKRAKGFTIAALVFVGITCAVGAFAFFAINPNLAEVSGLITALIGAYALSLFLTGLVEKKRAENHDFASLSQSTRTDSGSGLAITLCKGKLQAQGYQQFFTPARMKELKLPLPATTR
jgi:hypothetical protein